MSDHKPSVSKKTRKQYAADFETVTDPNDCRVWLWGIADVSDNPEMEWGIDLDSFIGRVQHHNAIVHFHNLKFDGMFILDWLLKASYIHVGEYGQPLGSFRTLISDSGKFYSITVRWRNGKTTEFRDSWKKLPMSAAKVAKAFQLEESKGSIDYDAYRPVGYLPSEDELRYLYNDVIIIAKAMNETVKAGMTKLTVGADSLAEFKELTGTKMFQRMYPTFSQEMDAEIRRAYRGGFTYAAERFRGKELGNGLVLDVNSLYPYVMYDRPLPWGIPEFVDGFVEPSDRRPLTIFSVTFIAKLKPYHIPCIQVKRSRFFLDTEYVKEISEPVTLMVTDIDWKLYNDHYDIQVLAYGGGWRFQATHGMFAEYIDKWSRIKAESEGGRREIAKLHLNSLYGKFASNPNVTGKIPTLKDGMVKLVKGPEEFKNPVYTPVGVFVTAYARDLTIRSAQLNYDSFAYADTDSLHLLTSEVPTEINVHPTELGAWKHEYNFKRAFYIRAKAYLNQKEDGTYKNAIAGVPEDVSGALRIEDLEPDKILHGKLHPRTVPGGVVLEPVEFKLKLT